MLCKNCENEIPENKTVCANCGTEVSLKSSDRKRKSFIGKHEKKDKLQNNITYVALSDDKTPADSLKVKIVQSHQLTEKSSTDDKNTAENNSLADKSSANETPEENTAAGESEKKENNYNTDDPYNDFRKPRSSYVPIGTEYVKTDRELPKAGNIHTMSSSGIIYEIAEELYRREKTAAEIEALCQPPFKRVFDRDQLERLDMQAKEKTRTLISNISEAEPQQTKKAEPQKEQVPISTASAFLLQLLFFIPIVNVAFAFYYSFGKHSNYNKKAYSRAFLIFGLIFMTGALIFFAFCFFKSPSNLSKIIPSLTP